MVAATYAAITFVGLALLSAIGYRGHAAIVVLAALFAALVLRELRRDVYQLATFWLFFGAVAGLGSLLVSLDQRGLGWPLGGACVVSWAWAVAFLARVRFAKESRPHPLRQRFPEARIHEQAGVHFVLEELDRERLVCGVFDVRVLLLNTWDRPRTVSVVVQPRRGILQLLGGAEVAPQGEPVSLEGGAWGVLSVPISVTAPERLRFYVAVRADGAGGRRIWKRPARTVPMHVSPFATVLIAIATLGTNLLWGGGLYVPVPAGERRRAPGGPLARRWFPAS